METEFYGDGQHNGGVFFWGNLNPYIYTYQNPIKYIDPNGKQVIAIHGTWSDRSTWENPNSIRNIAMTAFGNRESNFSFEWSSSNTSTARSIAAAQLIASISSDRKGMDPREPITLVGHSHGGNVAIEAINIMVEMPEFRDIDINLITINTPVRSQYQLNEVAQNRVDHLNVYDPKDPVQVNGGGSTVIGNGKKKLTGEFGKAGRTYTTPNTKNIKVKNPQGVTGDFHNSHNRTKDWQDQVPNSNKNNIMNKLVYLILVVVIVVLIFIIFKQGINIKNFKSKQLTYNELPSEIRSLLSDIASGNANSLVNENLIVLDEMNVYNLEIKKTGPWTDYSLLRNQNTGAKIKIPRGFPHPYIIYKKKIYLSKDYNVIRRSNYGNIIKSLYYEYSIN